MKSMESIEIIFAQAFERFNPDHGRSFNKNHMSPHEAMVERAGGFRKASDGEAKDTTSRDHGIVRLRRCVHPKSKLSQLALPGLN